MIFTQLVCKNSHQRTRGPTPGDLAPFLLLLFTDENKSRALSSSPRSSKRGGVAGGIHMLKSPPSENWGAGPLAARVAACTCGRGWVRLSLRAAGRRGRRGAALELLGGQVGGRLFQERRARGTSWTPARARAAVTVPGKQAAARSGPGRLLRPGAGPRAGPGSAGSETVTFSALFPAGSGYF